MENKSRSRAAAKASAVKPVGKKPAPKRPAVKLPAKRPSTPAAEHSPSVEALLSLVGTITEEEAEVLRETLRRSRSEGCDA